MLRVSNSGCCRCAALVDWDQEAVRAASSGERFGRENPREKARENVRENASEKRRENAREKFS